MTIAENKERETLNVAFEAEELTPSCGTALRQLSSCKAERIHGVFQNDAIIYRDVETEILPCVIKVTRNVAFNLDRQGIPQ
jgi:hypothetical protein